MSGIVNAIAVDRAGRDKIDADIRRQVKFNSYIEDDVEAIESADSTARLAGIRNQVVELTRLLRLNSTL